MIGMREAFIILITAMLASPAWAQANIGTQMSADINFSDAAVTEAELDITEQTYADPAVAPDSPFYAFKRLWESFRYALANSKENKASLHLEFAKERLAETKYLIKKNRTGEALKYVDEYESEINKSRGVGANISAIAKETEDALLKSALVLELVREKAPASAQPALARAINNSLEKKARIKAEREADETEKEIQPPAPAVSGQLSAATIAAPPSREQMIESAIKKELEQENEKQEARRKSIEKIEEKRAEIQKKLAEPSAEKAKKIKSGKALP